MKYLLLFLCGVSTVAFTEACRCFVGHPQTNFCRSDYVIEARVLSEATVDTLTKRYSVQVLNNYKSGYMVPYPNSNVWIYTASSSAACGVRFDIGNTYVITGSISDDRLRANTCSWNVEVSNLTGFQVTALKNGLYRNNCRCEIRSCRHNVCEPGEGCLAPYESSGCYHDNAACQSSSGTCQWTRNRC